MDPRLLKLICAYQADAAEALAQFLQRAGLRHPFEWRQAGLPRTGILAGEAPIRYAFHGAGLELTVEKRHVDFDFGFDGRTGGFNFWWLHRYAEAHADRFPEFVEPSQLEAKLQEARQAGEIGRPFQAQQDDLEYLLTDMHSQRHDELATPRG